MAQYYFSPTTKGFYVPEIHGDGIPSDAVEVSEQYYAELMAGQELGRVVVVSAQGTPVLGDAPVVELNYAQKRAAEYPPMADYLDGVVKGDQEQINAYIAACLAVKAKYPKP